MTNKNTLVLLAGWGLGTQPLNALAASLETELRSFFPDFKVLLQPLPAVLGMDRSKIIQQLDDQLPQNCWLAGWSLGGMLATAVAAQRNQTTTKNTCMGLISLASNACFVANNTWQNAMPANTFVKFYTLCEKDLAKGLKRFSLLCSQGAAASRQLAAELNNHLESHPSDLAGLEYLAGLDLLASLDNRAAITNYSAPQLHLFAENDALVPIAAAADLQSLNVAAVVEILGQSHACVLAEPQLLAQRMAAFIASHQNA